MLDGISDTVSVAPEDVDLGRVAVDPAAYLKEFGLSYGDNGEVRFTLLSIPTSSLAGRECSRSPLP